MKGKEQKETACHGSKKKNLYLTRLENAANGFTHQNANNASDKKLCSA